jgi:hypothetical protein
METSQRDLRLSYNEFIPQPFPEVSPIWIINSFFILDLFLSTLYASKATFAIKLAQCVLRISSHYHILAIRLFFDFSSSASGQIFGFTINHFATSPAIISDVTIAKNRNKKSSLNADPVSKNPLHNRKYSASDYCRA